MTKKIRVRYAPSPTGNLHIGNARTALFNYLFARHNDGEFIIRIEDTDQKRNLEHGEESQLQNLKWLGMDWDEGPDKPGKFGPYRQSERQHIYDPLIDQLLLSNRAYKCYCTEDELETEREHQRARGEMPHYGGKCANLTPSQQAEKEAQGITPVIRFRVPIENTYTFDDIVKGPITFEASSVGGDYIIRKRDGFPTYNFANVVDDHLMGITHVVRGNEYISSSPKYNRLYDAFGWEVPKYIHCPLITDEEHHKLSKRSGHSSFEDLIEQGFLSEAVVNFVALLGWSPEDNNEILSLEDLVKQFDYHRINKSPAVFDYTKLRWMNGEYLKKMEDDRFYELALPFMKEAVHRDVDFHKIAAMIKTRIEIWPDIRDMISFFDTLPVYDNSIYCNKKMKTDKTTSLEVLKELLPLMEAQTDYSNDGLYNAVKEYVAGKGCKNGYVLWPLRIAVSGREMTPCGATEIMEVIGRQETCDRIRKGIEQLEK